jgi:hypothetical protein
MMKRLWRLLTWGGVGLWLCFSTAARLPAQSVLERLENQIRQRTEKGAEPGNPPPAPAPPPAPQTPENRPAPGYLGVMADDRHDRGRGVRILDVYRGSPAEKAGLHKQDLVTGVGDFHVRQMDDLAEVLVLYAPGETVELTLLRGNAPLKVRVTLGTPPPGKSTASNPPEVIPAPTAQGAPGQPFLLPPGPRTAEKPPQLSGEQGVTEPPGPMDLILPPPQRPLSATEAKIEDLQRHVQELEQRVRQLERELAELKKKPS